MKHLENAQAVEDFCNKCHKAAANWWVNLETGKPLDRNVGEMLCLVHSELDEAYECWRTGMDSHLPHRRSVEVELADTMIRIGDILIGLGVDVKQIWLDHKLEVSGQPKFMFSPPVVEKLFNMAHGHVTMAFEASRKGRMSPRFPTHTLMGVHLTGLLAQLSVFNALLELDIDEAIIEKMAYNAKRADHKLENRAKRGGKKC